VVGGDCTITLGVIAGFRRRYPDVGLIYADKDADLRTPETADSIILDATGVAHLLGHGSAELAQLGGPPPPTRVKEGISPGRVSSRRPAIGVSSHPTPPDRPPEETSLADQPRQRPGA
jgi:arginase family enzyme